MYKTQKIFILMLLVLTPMIPVFASFVPRDFLTEVEKGNIPGHELVTIRGHSESIGASEQLIWDIAANYVFPAAATQMNVSSTDVDDVAGGNGLWNVTVYGLSFAGAEIDEVVQMNGQNPVGTVGKYFRINRLIGIEGGPFGGNEGTVYIGVGAPAAGVPSVATYNMIEPTRSLSLCGVYSVPVNHTLILLSGRAGTSDNKLVSFGFASRDNAGLDDEVWRHNRHLEVDQQFIYLDAVQTMCQRADIKLLAEAASADTHVNFKYRTILIDNDVLHNSTLLWSDGETGEVDNPTGANNNMLLFILIVLVVVAIIGLGKRR